MQVSRQRKKKRWLFTIGIATAFLVIAIHGLDGFQRLEWITQDARSMALRGQATPHSDLALILIDEASLSHLNPVLGRFPWPRSVYARVLEYLSRGNPRAVVFDILFTENQWLDGARDGPSSEDRELMMATAAAGNVHHAIQLIREQPDEAADLNLGQPLPEQIRGRFGLADAAGFPDRGRNRWLLPFDGLAELSRGLGVVGLEPDRDGVYRRVRPVFRYQDTLMPALSTTALVGRLGLEEAEYAEGAIRTGRERIAVDDSGRLRLNFYGDVPRYSISGVIDSLARARRGEMENLLIEPGEFEDKIVFIGGSAVGLQDLKYTPMSSEMPGAVIHLTAASNLLKGDYLRPSPPWLTPALIAFLSLATAFCFLLPRAWQQLVLPGVMLCLLVVGGFVAFAHHHIVELVAPASSLLFSGLGCLAYVSATEGRDRRRVRRMLSQYVSPAVLADVVDRHEEHIRAEVGSDEEMTILFSDIRGFTSISEGYPAAEVVALLNRYLSRLTEAIFDNEGTLDKFIGDAIMAFWGAPIRVADHAERSVRAAMAMQQGVSELNRELREEGWSELRTGIGMHTGRVILGNIGSERKLDYTVIGDNVNLASRMEGLTSQYGCPVLISDTTRVRLGEGFVCALVDRVRVKGRRQSVGVWRPLAVPEDDAGLREWAREMADASERAWNCYRDRQWDAAIAQWQRLPEVDPVRERFVEICRRLQRDGVDADWDGINRLDRK